MDELELALKTWMAAERARHDWSMDYFTAGWTDDPAGSVIGAGKVLTKAALDEAKRLDESARDARQAYDSAWRAR